jgi:amidase
MDRRIFLASAALGSSAIDIASANERIPDSAENAASKIQARTSRPLWSWTATELAAALQEGSISSREATESCLGRMNEVNSSVNAVVESLETEALAAADEADRRRSKAGTEVLPALLGIPVTTKINVDLKGHPTTDGVVAFRQAIAKEDHSSVANLRKGGAIIIGRTNTPAFSFRWFSDNDLHGRTLNPWDPTVTPGGSSGGAASAAAVGIGPIAHGNDIAGSVRYPAYCCGIAGIRPTVGLVPSYNPSSENILPGISAQLMGVQGLLARSVADLRLALPVIAERDTRDASWTPVDRRRRSLPERARIAMLTELPGMKVEPSVQAGLRVAKDALKRAGYEVDEVVPPRFQEAADLWSPFVLSEIGPGLSAAAQKFGDTRIQTALKTWLSVTDLVTLPGFSEILGKRYQIRREWSKFFQAYPIVITPASWRDPFPLDFDQQGPEAFRKILQAQSPSLVIALLGVPGLTVPTGLYRGLPTGVQVVAEWFREDLCFDAGAAIEASVNMNTPIDPRSARAT